MFPFDVIALDISTQTKYKNCRSVPWTVLIPVFTILLGYLSDQKQLGGIVLPTLKDKYGAFVVDDLVRLDDLSDAYALAFFFGGEGLFRLRVEGVR